MEEVSWHVAEGSYCYPVHWSPFSKGFIFLLFSCPQFPSVAAASFPFLLAMWALFLEGKILLTPAGLLGVAAQKAINPKESNYQGTWSWWWRVGRETHQLLDLNEATLETIFLGSLGDAWIHVTWSRWERIKCWHCKWGEEHGGQAHEQCLFGVSLSYRGKHGDGHCSPTQPPTQDSNLVECSGKPHASECSGPRAKVVTRAGTIPVLWSSPASTKQWQFLQTFSAFHFFTTIKLYMKTFHNLLE